MPYITLPDGRVVYSPLIIEGEQDDFGYYGPGSGTAVEDLRDEFRELRQQLGAAMSAKEREALRKLAAETTRSTQKESQPSDEELDHTKWEQLKNRIWREARTKREADWNNLSSANKRKLGKIAGGMAKQLATDEGRFDDLVGDLVEVFDRMLAEEKGQSQTPTPTSASSGAQGTINLKE